MFEFNYLVWTSPCWLTNVWQCLSSNFSFEHWLQLFISSWHCCGSDTDAGVVDETADFGDADATGCGVGDGNAGIGGDGDADVSLV